MPSAKRKPGRNPLQRLSDQRRSLALAGLAVGAVFSGAILRRKRCRGEAEFDAPMPPAEATVTRPESAPPAAVEVSVAAAPDPPATATGTQADPKAPEAATSAPEATAVASSSIADPATGELSAEEASILAVLAQHGRSDDDRTVIAVATSLERDSAEVADVLRKLSAEGVVAGDLYTAAGDKIWAVTERGVRRLGAQN